MKELFVELIVFGGRYFVMRSILWRIVVFVFEFSLRIVNFLFRGMNIIRIYVFIYIEVNIIFGKGIFDIGNKNYCFWFVFY